MICQQFLVRSILSLKSFRLYVQVIIKSAAINRKDVGEGILKVLNDKEDLLIFLKSSSKDKNFNKTFFTKLASRFDACKIPLLDFLSTPNQMTDTDKKRRRKK